MFAPNGKPSNLNTEQYVLVRTPEFKEWFGDWENDPENSSKVVDENGEPLVVYHGTRSFTIDSFDRKKSNRLSSGIKEYGHYFTDNYDVANFYRSMSKISNEALDEINKKINIEKEKMYNSRNSFDYEESERKINFLESSKKGKVHSFFLNLRCLYTFDAKGKTFNNAWNELKVNADYKTAINRDAMEFIKDGLFGVNKCDGIKAENIVDATVEGNDFLKNKLFGNVFLVFDGNESMIKLADGTNTTFDSDNSDVRYEKGGQVDSNYRKNKISKVMREFKKGLLHSSSGELVTDRKQAIAIAISEADSVHPKLGNGGDIVIGEDVRVKGRYYSGVVKSVKGNIILVEYPNLMGFKESVDASKIELL